jgi:hypothetical protein
MVKKILVSLVLAGSLAAGSAGAAAAAPKSNCTKAPATIARLKAEEAQLTSTLASLQGKATSGDHETWRLERRIESLIRDEARLALRVSKLQARCPSGGGSGGGGTIIA